MEKQTEDHQHFPRVRHVAHVMLDQVLHDPQPYESEHYRPEDTTMAGAPEALEEVEQQTLELGTGEGTVDWHRSNGW